MFIKALKYLVAVTLLVSISFSADAQSKKRKKKKTPPPPPVEEPAPVPVDTPVTDPGWGAQPAPVDTPVVDTPTTKPYERIVLEFDSITNLIIYQGVVEQEESSSDSIYMRAKKWITAKYGTPKFDLDKKNQKIVFNASVPAYNYTNKYAKKPMGRYNFKITIWIKEGRYRYMYSNFVHESEKGNNGVATRNYFEYYYTTTTNVKGSDKILRYADKDINELIAQMKKALKDPLVVDEDDW